jgi:hypothetical protein
MNLIFNNVLYIYIPKSNKLLLCIHYQEFMNSIDHKPQKKKEETLPLNCVFLVFSLQTTSKQSIINYDHV